MFVEQQFHLILRKSRAVKKVLPYNIYRKAFINALYRNTVLERTESVYVVPYTRTCVQFTKYLLI
jgi:hypothetical protein